MQPSYKILYKNDEDILEFEHIATVYSFRFAQKITDCLIEECKENYIQNTTREYKVYILVEETRDNKICYSVVMDEGEVSKRYE